MPARDETDWRNWLKRVEARQSRKARYIRFYETLDSSVPGWVSIIQTPAFLQWGTARDPETGSCIFDMMIECWDDPAWHAEQFAIFLRLFIREGKRSAPERRGIGKVIGRLFVGVPESLKAPYRRVLSGRYEIIKTLGGGGNGNVYLAWSRETLSLYGLKIIRRELWHDAAVVGRFKKEIEIWVKLGVHPNIVAASFLDIKDDILYMTMEYVEEGEDAGPSLAEKIQIGKISNADAAKWFAQIADGLDHGYSRGIASHRDIKPGNILITRDGTAKITDFGLASPLPDFNKVRASGDTMNWTDTAPGSLLGTPLYMAPEQFTDVSGCDQRSDIYSLGITLYQAVTGGKLPFMPPAPRDLSLSELQRFLRDVRSMHENAAPPRLRSPFWPVIEKCLKKRPEQRFADIAEFRSAIQAAAEATGLSVPPKAAAEESIWAYRDKGNTLMRLGKYEEAIAAFDRFLTVIPDDSALFNKAVSLENLGRLDEALELYQRFCKQGDHKAFVNAAACYIKLGKNVLALESAFRATELKPNDESGWIALGNAEFARGRSDAEGGKESSSRELFIDAAMAYRRAVAISPLEPTPHYNLALARRKAGDIDGAARSLTRFLKFASPLDNRRATAQELLDAIKAGK
jgi:serine/threonine protein kinase